MNGIIATIGTKIVLFTINPKEYEYFRKSIKLEI